MPGSDPNSPRPITPALRRLSPELLDSFTPAQRAAVIAALVPPPGSHSIDLRTSIPLFGGRYYLTVLAGRERRSLDRLAREGQLDLKRVVCAYAALSALVAAPIVMLLVVSLAFTTLAGLDALDPPILALHELMHRF